MVCIGRSIIKSKALAVQCARLADSKKAEDIVILDVSEVSSITSFFVICTGSIDRHVRAIADEIEEKLKEHKVRYLHHDEDEDSLWIVIDYVDVIVHVFERQKREYYQLEKLWADAEMVAWSSIHE